MRRRSPVGCLLLAWLLAPACFAQAKPWPEVLGKPQGKWPAPLTEVTWRADLDDAFAEARESNRPLFITLRCLPCKQCSSFDKDVLEGGAELAPLLRQFVTVRLTDAMAIDLTRLPVQGFQDLDLSWWGYVLSPDAQVYSIFGGRDEVSDATRISKQSLANSLRRTLDHHYDPRRKQWNVDGAPVAKDAKSKAPDQLPGYDPWHNATPYAQKQTCLHCHQIADVLRQPALANGTFDKQRDTNIWPLPENVGLSVDRDDGLLVTDVLKDSAAARIGVKVGDRLATANHRRLFGQADLRGVLHRNANPSGTIHLRWLRNDKIMAGDLQLQDGWRRTVLDWRMSISQGLIGTGPGFFPLQARNRPKDKMAIAPFFGRNAKNSPAHKAGMRGNHVIVAVDGERQPLVGRGFLVWFRLHYNPGDTVVFTVLAGKKERDIKVVLPKR